MNKSLKVLFIFNGIFVFAYYLISPLYAIFAEGIAKDLFLVSLTVSIHFASTMVFCFLLSKYGDRVKEKEYLLMGGFLVRAVAWFSFIFTRNFYQLLAIQAFLGIGEAIGTSSFNAIFAEHLDDNKHIKEYANWHVITNFVAAMSSACGGFIASRFGWTPLFLIMSGLALVSFFGILSKPRTLL